MSLTLKVKRLSASAKLPTQGHVHDAAYDIYTNEEVTLKPGGREQVKTGIALEIPKGYSVFIWDKSGLSHKHGLKTIGGVIDEGYKGEVMVGMINLGDGAYTLERGHKVAQIVLQKREDLVIEEIAELSDSVRGEGAFGSTGK